MSWNLPDDVTDADVDRAAHGDECPDCDGSGCETCEPEPIDPDAAWDDHG